MLEPNEMDVAEITDVEIGVDELVPDEEIAKDVDPEATEEYIVDPVFLELDAKVV